MWKKPISCVCAVLLSFMVHPSFAQSIIVQSTTSTKNSGLYGHLLPLVKADTGIDVRVVAVGTGAAIKNAMNCDGDVLLVHATAREQQFVRGGYGIERFDVMYNDFILVGPSSDPAGISIHHEHEKAFDVVVAFKKIAMARMLFASRGDDSGTHIKEKSLWQAAGIDVAKNSGTWYRETGSGMGATLNVAVGMGAYAMTDRATWISHANKGELVILAQGDPRLFNQYGIILVNPEKCPFMRAAAGQTFIDWMLSDRGQGAIETYRIGGQQLFFPNARHQGR